MRVVRTELYFDDEAITGASRRRRLMTRRQFEEEKNHGIAFAWFKGPAPGPFLLGDYKWFDGRDIDLSQVGEVLDLLIREEDRILPNLLRAGVQNASIVEFVLEQDIVIEASPPIAIKFKELLKKTNAPVLVGTYMGLGMAGDYPALMLITVPGGIIAVGSALGIADAIAYGLNKRIKRLFDGK